MLNKCYVQRNLRLIGDLNNRVFRALTVFGADSTPIVSEPRPTSPDLELVGILEQRLRTLSFRTLNEPSRGFEPSPELLKAAKLEYEWFRRNGFPVPRFVDDKLLRAIIRYPEKSQTGRMRLYGRILAKETEADERLSLKLERMQSYREALVERARTEFPGFDPSRHWNLYDDHGKFLFGPQMKIWNYWRRDMRDELNRSNALFGRKFGQPLVIDLGLPYEMQGREASSAISQILDIHDQNASQWEPFNLYLCNYDPKNEGLRNMVERKAALWHVTGRCFTEVFPAERLVYLSPDAPVTLRDFRHDHVYVLGALVDKRVPSNYSAERAAQLGIRSARFDLQAFLELTKQKPPYLAFSDVFAAIVDGRDTNGNWFYAFRNFITGRKRMLRWRGEFDAVAALDACIVHENYRNKYFENQRPIFKPKAESPGMASIIEKIDDGVTLNVNKSEREITDRHSGDMKDPGIPKLGLFV